MSLHLSDFFKLVCCYSVPSQAPELHLADAVMDDVGDTNFQEVEFADLTIGAVGTTALPRWKVDWGFWIAIAQQI